MCDDTCSSYRFPFGGMRLVICHSAVGLMATFVIFPPLILVVGSLSQMCSVISRISF